MRRNLMMVILTLTLTAIMAVSFAGCGTPEKESEEAAEATVAETQEEDIVSYADMAGDYQDSVSQRATLTLTPDDNGEAAVITVLWSNSAFDTMKWTMTATIEDHILSYSNCQCTELIYNEEGNLSEEKAVYSGGKGFFTYTDKGTLKWDGAADESCRESEFVLMTE